MSEFSKWFCYYQRKLCFKRERQGEVLKAYILQALYLRAKRPILTVGAMVQM